MPTSNDKKQDRKPDEQELDLDALQDVSGGAAYIKFDGIDGEIVERVQKVDAFSIKQKG